MNLSDYTIQTGFQPQLKCETLEQAIKLLVDALAAGGTVARQDGLVREILRREGEGSTAVGGGLVIPHARWGELAEVRLAVATLAEPLDISATDDTPVDIVILLVGPLGDPRQMLRVLARLARVVRSAEFLDNLRGATTAGELESAFSAVGDSAAP